MLISACFDYGTNISSNIVNIRSISKSSFSRSVCKYLKRNPYVACEAQNVFLLAARNACPCASPYTQTLCAHYLSQRGATGLPSSLSANRDEAACSFNVPNISFC